MSKDPDECSRSSHCSSAWIGQAASDAEQIMASWPSWKRTSLIVTGMSMQPQLPEATAEQLLIEICKLPPESTVAGTLTASEVSYALQWLIGQAARTRKCERIAVGLLDSLEKVVVDWRWTNCESWREQAKHVIAEAKAHA
jgi:hypothetical protein